MNLENDLGAIKRPEFRRKPEDSHLSQLAYKKELTNKKDIIEFQAIRLPVSICAASDINRAHQPNNGVKTKDKVSYLQKKKDRSITYLD